MRLPQGYATIVEPEKATVEMDTFTCGHCNHVCHVKPKSNPEDTGGLCKLCMKLICKDCVGKLVCDPFERKLERMESRDRMLSAIQ